MKKASSLFLAFALILSLAPTVLAAPSSGVAYPSTQPVYIDGTPLDFQMYAIYDDLGNPTNYVKVRDVAYALSFSYAHFSVEWNGSVDLIPGGTYVANGTEMVTPYTGEHTYTAATSTTCINGVPSQLEAIVLYDDNGGGYTYYKLRDLGEALGFLVDWSAEKGVSIQTVFVPTPELVTLYSVDGKTMTVLPDEVATYVAVGWFTEPLVTIYSPAGWTLAVTNSELASYQQQGWYTYPVKTVYNASGKSLVIASGEADKYMRQGWYKSVETAKNFKNGNSAQIVQGLKAMQRYIKSATEKANVLNIGVAYYASYYAPGKVLGDKGKEKRKEIANSVDAIERDISAMMDIVKQYNINGVFDPMLDIYWTTAIPVCSDSYVPISTTKDYVSMVYSLSLKYSDLCLEYNVTG